MSEHLDGRLTQADIDKLYHHVRTCSNCAARWQALQRVSALFRTAEVAEPPSDFTARVMGRLAAVESERFAAPGNRSLWLALATAASAVVVIWIAVVTTLSALPQQAAPAGGPSFNYVALSLQVSQMAIRWSTMLDALASAVGTVVRLVPLPILVLAILWMLTGTLALTVTVATLVRAYRPMAVQQRIGMK
jgi:hypothetical protein